MNDLTTAFNDYFEVVAADTQELQRHVFRMRYRVYCEELCLEGFDASAYPDGLEWDEYDQRSAHYLLRHRRRNEYVGTVRLILPNAKNPEERFPLEIHAAERLSLEQSSRERIPRDRLAEISRLILSRSLRSRPGESDSPYSTADNVPPGEQTMSRRRFPHPVLGLFVAIMRMSAQHAITHWYAGMEPVLNRLLRRFKVPLKAIGPVIQYHGARQPFVGVINDVMRETYLGDREVWSFITESGSIWPPPRLAA
ncbi:MAG: PEP-CTERM/exosortase system-associated acyltransferase [Gammaproteobacteria bacterium]